jgi:hypothetical protein
MWLPDCATGCLMDAQCNEGQNIMTCVRLSQVFIKVQIFWDIMPFQLVKIDASLRGVTFQKTWIFFSFSLLFYGSFLCSSILYYCPLTFWFYFLFVHPFFVCLHLFCFSFCLNGLSYHRYIYTCIHTYMYVYACAYTLTYICIYGTYICRCIHTRLHSIDLTVMHSRVCLVCVCCFTLFQTNIIGGLN